MVCRIMSSTIRGIEACMVAVETDISDGLPGFEMVGLLSSEVREARERARTALKNSGFIVPPKRITINFSPADIRKTGTYFDFPIAVSILVGMGIVEERLTENALFVGELGLEGNAVKVNGILPIVLAAKTAGVKRCFVPKDNVCECTLVDDICVVGVENLGQLVQILISEEMPAPKIVQQESYEECFDYDFCDIKGQLSARRGAEILAAGMHNMLMIGSPGAGKTMIAKCIPSILPDMTPEERMEVAGVQSVAGILGDGRKLSRPFRSPHHSSTISALTGGGLNPGPGEVTLAHRGVLFLDEFPEFSRQAIEVLRQPMEDRQISISRVGGKYKFPADFILLAASNPCKCGYYPDRNRCSCTEYDIKKYMEKISGPILDRIDICVHVEPVKYMEINSDKKAESSREIRSRVLSAKQIQADRYRELDIDFNGQLDGRYIKEYCELGQKENAMMERAFDMLGLSVRGYCKVLKVARTIADLDESKSINCSHLSEALTYRV